MTFRNRDDAGEQLATQLTKYRGRHALVLGIPRGGVPMAALVARRLNADLDVMLVHKLRAPDQPEVAIGSIDEAGRVYLTPFGEELRDDPHRIEVEKRHQLQVLKARRARYSAARPPMALTGRVVILVDDGLATGATMIAAVAAARAQRAARVVVAVGVAPPATVARLKREADEVVCVLAPAGFMSVGQYFDDFSEVTDEQVEQVLTEMAGVPATSIA